MNKMSMAAIAVLLVSVMFIGAQSRKTLGTVDVATIEAMEHQRILAGVGGGPPATGTNVAAR